jgi:hypothetical protein
MYSKKIIIALGAGLLIAVGFVCISLNKAENELFEENFEALMDTETSAGRLCAYQPDEICYYSDAFGVLIINNGTFFQ